MEFDLLDAINSFATLVTSVVALVSLLFSIYLNRILRKKEENRISLSVMTKANILEENLKKDYFALIVRFYSPSRRKARITNLYYLIHKKKFHYFLSKVPIIRKIYKGKYFIAFAKDGVRSLFLGGITELEDGKETIYKIERSKLISQLKLEKKNVLVIGILAEPELQKEISVNAKELF